MPERDKCEDEDAGSCEARRVAKRNVWVTYDSILRLYERFRFIYVGLISHVYRSMYLRRL
jgi:hypothetical protein